MNNTIKGILAAIPLVVGLSGPATAALSESADTPAQNGSPVAIVSLLNHFSGLTPGDHDALEAEDRTISHSQKISAFTSAGAPMSSYYTGQGSENIVSGFGSSYSGGRGGSGEAEAAPPSAGLTSVIHLSQESLGSVAAGISPSSAGTSNQAAGNPANDGNATYTTTIIPGTDSNVSITTTIIPADATPVPLPAAVVLLGSGLAALASLRKRSRKTILQVS